MYRKEFNSVNFEYEIKYVLEGILAKHSAKAKIEFLPLLSSDIGEKPAARALYQQDIENIKFWENKIDKDRIDLKSIRERRKHMYL